MTEHLDKAIILFLIKKNISLQFPYTNLLLATSERKIVLGENLFPLKTNKLLKM